MAACGGGSWAGERGAGVAQSIGYPQALWYEQRCRQARIGLAETPAEPTSRRLASPSWFSANESSATGRPTNLGVFAFEHRSEIIPPHRSRHTGERG